MPCLEPHILYMGSNFHCMFSVVVIHRTDQRAESLDPVSRLLEEEGVEIVVVSQILVQFRRFTSIPRVPTITPAVSWKATAMVKHGSPVSNES